MATRRQPPTVRLRRIAADLLRLRNEAGLTRKQVEDAIGFTIGALLRVEKAQARPQKRTLLALLELYGVKDAAVRQDFLTNLRLSRQLGWLQTFEDALPENYQTFISFESEADKVTTYQQGLVPGLLQTRAYADAVIRGNYPSLPADDVAQRTEVRLRRQELLVKKEPLHLWAVIDEAVIRRPIGGTAVMREQLERLVDAATMPNVTLQILPYSAGAHPGVLGAFVVMDFPSPDPPIVYIDTMAGELFIEAEPDVERYRDMYQQLIALALSPAESTKMIKETAQAAD